jgi:D-methionine transport system ATP-binding protein
MSIISFKNATKEFHARKLTTRAVDHVTFNSEEGEIFGVIGHSGAGKSTLVRLINQLEGLSSGELEVLGKSVGHLGESGLKELRKDIGMIFQEFNLFNAKTVAKNIEYPLKLGGWSKESREKRVKELLEFVGLSEKANQYPKKLSGGQKQRVGIARALATRPKILLADEATSALDPETTIEVLKLLRKANQEFGVTIVIITHTMSVLRMVCQKAAVMDQGKVVEVGEVKQIFEKPEHAVTKRFVETIHALEKGDLDAV